VSRGLPFSQTAFLAFQSGDRSGLSYFFDLHYASLLLFAEAILKTSGEGEEIVDEAFLKAWDRRAEFEGPHNLRLFLYRCTKNACIDILRQRSRARGRVKYLTAVQENQTPSIESALIQANTYSEILASLSNLPPKCRQILVLSTLEEKSYEEIAQEMKISVHTVRNQRARAIRMVRKYLNLPILLLLGGL